MVRRRTELRAGLRLGDLRTTSRTATKLMNVQIPDATASGIARIAHATHRTKTDVVIALLNEGLAALADLRRAQRQRSRPRRRKSTQRARR